MLNRMKHVSHSPEETHQIAQDLARNILHKHQGKTVVIALEGELGAGKTTFVQAFAKALGVKHHLKSPTFVLMKHYLLEDAEGYENLYHFDCYRLQDSSELKVLSIEDILNSSGNIVLIEWAERVADILPENHLTVHIDHIAEHTRNISIHGE